MSFPSISFLFLFFPIFLFAYVWLPGKNFVILSFSLVFYAWGEGVYVLLLLLTILINFVVGQQIHQNAHCPSRAKNWLFGGVSADLLILFYYKYFGFIVTSVLGMTVSQDRIPLLVLGISFFIFQSISYLVDVFRKEAVPCRSFFDLALYISMFPQLIAGPIVRFSTISSAIHHRTVNLVQVRNGAMLLVVGLAQKILIANKAGLIADAAFNLPLDQVSMAVSGLGAGAYTLQIYFDFSGYSTMAIGIGLIMGFDFPANFNYPYISRSVTEFWRRWHMSLSRWFRDYVYISLGGNRKGAGRTYINLFIVFFLCGLWHGAAWTFIVWGIYYGLLLALERLVVGRILAKLPPLISLAYTLFLVLVGWIIFRAETFTQAWVFIRALFTGADWPMPSQIIRVLTPENLIFCALGILLSTPAIPLFFTDRGLWGSTAVPVGVGSIFMWCSAFFVFVCCCIYIYAGTYNPFLYFRF